MNSCQSLRRAVLAAALVAMIGLASCGGEPNLACDKPQFYQEAAQHSKVVPPDDLDILDPIEEMPLPEANPAPERPPGSPCIDMPPRLISVD